MHQVWMYGGPGVEGFVQGRVIKVLGGLVALWALTMATEGVLCCSIHVAFAVVAVDAVDVDVVYVALAVDVVDVDVVHVHVPFFVAGMYSCSEKF